MAADDKTLKDLAVLFKKSRYGCHTGSSVQIKACATRVD
jgi:hypothetical protein